MTYWVHNIKVVGVASIRKSDAILRDSDTELRLSWNKLQNSGAIPVSNLKVNPVFERNAKKIKNAYLSQDQVFRVNGVSNNLFKQSLG